jgi:hypothetical protein
MFQAWSDRPDVRSDRQLWPVVESSGERGALVGV